MKLIQKTLIFSGLIAFSSITLAQETVSGSTLPAGIGEQPIIIKTNEPFKSEVQNLLKKEEQETQPEALTEGAQPTQETAQSQTQQAEAVAEEQPRQQPQRLQLYPKTPPIFKGNKGNQFGSKYYKSYKPHSLPHFQYRQNQTQGQYGQQLPAYYYQRNYNVIRVDKEGIPVNQSGAASTNNANTASTATATTTAASDTKAPVPVETNKYNKERFKSVPKFLRNHPSWQGGHYLHFPDEPPPK